VRVLGSAAGGGFPQWNCNCRNCAGVRSGTVKARARTQSSIAVSGNSEHAAWALVNASPDILAQLAANPDLQPGRAPRDTALTGIVFVDGQIDHTTGLYMLREARAPWQVWCTDSVHADLTRGHPVLQALSHYCGIERRGIALDGSPFRVDGVVGVKWSALPVTGKAAPYSPHRGAPASGDNIALLVTDETTARAALYAPGLGAMDDGLWSVMQAASCVLVDGTFWSDDEMIQLGLSGKTAREIGHLPQSGPGGLLEWLERLPEDVRKILIHVNNTNPILDERSAERRQLVQRGIEVAWDGMEIEL